MKTSERVEARRLRAELGMSVRDIATRVGVSRSSVSLWVRDIVLTPEQHEALRQRDVRYDRDRRGSIARAAIARRRRELWQEEGRRLARRGEWLHAAGCMLFWAEGSRHRNAVRFSNSDPEMLRFFIHFLRSYWDIPVSRYRVWCNLFADHTSRQFEIESHWLDVLELPHECLTKSTVNVYSAHSQKKRTNKLPYGTCRLTVHDTRLVQSLYGSIQEYASFERRRWLD